MTLLHELLELLLGDRASIGVGHRILQLVVEQPALRQLDVEHLLARRLAIDSETGQHPEEAERAVGAVALRERQIRGYREGRAGLQDPLPEVLHR